MPNSRPAVAAALGCTLLSLLHAAAALAVAHHVSPGERIGDALAAAVAGDSVVVACGTYEESGLVLADGVTLTSETGDPDCVTIATTGGAPVISCRGAGPLTRIEGFTLTVAAGGWSEPVARGGGLLCDDSSPYVSRCRFVDLEAGYGGAVYCGAGSNPTIFACEFLGNMARAVGSAVNCVGGSQPVIARCLFAGNAMAVHAAGGSAPRIAYCTFAENQTALTGWDGAACLVTNSIIANGLVPWHGDRSCVPALACTDVWGNAFDWPELLVDQADRDGNFSANPVFCGEGTVGSPWSLDVESPCNPDGGGACGLVGAYEATCSGTVGIVDPPPEIAPPPARTALRTVFPNPFNPSTEIRFDLRRTGPVELAIYDLAGRLVARPLAASLPAGPHAATWNGRDRSGRAAAAGMYIVRLVADGIVDSRSVTLVK